MTVPLQPADCDFWLDDYLEFADPQEPRDYSWSEELKGFIARTEDLTRAVESRGWTSTPLVVFIQALRSFYYKHRANFPMAGNEVRLLVERLKYNLESQAGTTSLYHPIEAEPASAGTVAAPVSTNPPPADTQFAAIPADAAMSPHTPAAQPDAQSPPFPPVELHGQGKSPTVLGKSKPPLTTPQYNVVSALLQAGERGLNKDELVRKSGHADARAILGRVADLDPDWMAVVQLAGKTAGRYRIG